MAEINYHEAPAYEATALPVMLPGKLVGRDKILATIYGELKQNNPVLLYGEPGIGKTAVAATLASAYTQQAGGTLWFSVEEDTLAQLIVRVGRAYGDMDIANSETPIGKVGAAATLLATNKPLIVLDGNPLMPAVREFIKQLAPKLPILIVTEENAEGDWKAIEISPLADTDAVMLLKEKSGGDAPEFSEIATLLGNQPLALCVAAGTMRITKMEASKLLVALQQAAESNPNEQALQVGFNSLQQGLQGILLMLGATFSGKASLWLLTLLSGAQPETASKVMTILAAAGFVQQDMRYGTPYYALHPVVHAYAQAFLKKGGRLDTLTTKVQDAVLAYARQHATDTLADHDKLAVEMDTFQATAYWSSERGEGDIASQIVVTLTQAGDFVKARGYLYELLQLQDSGSSGVSAFPANASVPADVLEDDDLFDDDDELYDDDDSEMLAVIEPEIPSPESMMGGAGEAVDETDPDSLRVAVMNARGEGDSEAEQRYQEMLGKLLLTQGKPDEALAVYNELLLSYEDADDQPKILDTRLSLARLMVKLQSAQAAVLHATQGSKLAEELSDQSKQAQCLLLLGDARQLLGESTDAILAYSHALDLARAQDDDHLASQALMQLGFAQLDDDDPEIAIQTWDTALELCRKLNKRDCEGRILGGLGTAYGELSRWEEALNFHNSALYIAREVNDRKEEGLQLSNLGYAAKSANKLGDAVLRYRQALHVAYENDERENIVSTIVDLARILSESQLHLDIADMLINDALTRDPNDREVLALKQSITSARMMAVANDVPMKPVKGTAQEYASVAYALLDA